MSSGIYMLINNINGKFYIGSTKDFRKRKNSHFTALRRQKHCNKHLQRSFDMYGEKAFSFIRLHEYEPTELINNEQEYIDKFKPEYNQSKKANPGSAEKSPEHRRKISEANKGKVVSEETKKLISEARIGKPLTPEHKLAVSLGLLGRVQSEETRRKIGEANSRRIIKEETRKKLSEITKRQYKNRNAQYWSEVT